jgi:putative acetyltransferase
MDVKWTIEREGVDDATAVRAVHLAAFPTQLEADLVDLLRANGNAAVSLVARSGDEIVGHVLFSPVTVERGSEVVARGLGLAPLAVMPAQQRKGIGAALVRAGIEECRNKGTPFVVVLGGPEYYQRFGFVRASDFGLANEYGAMDEFMVLALGDAALPASGGLVRYGDEFRAFT